MVNKPQAVALACREAFYMSLMPLFYVSMPEITADVAESLNALRSNKSLQKELLSVLKKPERDLPTLSSEVSLHVKMQE